MRITSAKELIVYQKAYRLAMEVFEISQGFPSEERCALTGQARRSSRSVAMNLSEAWAKRRYEGHFVSIGRMLGSTINHPEKFLIPTD